MLQATLAFAARHADLASSTGVLKPSIKRFLLMNISPPEGAGDKTLIPVGMIRDLPRHAWYSNMECYYLH